MKKINVLTASRQTMTIKVEAIDELDFRPVISSDCNCVICEKSNPSIEIVSMAVSSEIRDQLKSFGFFTKEKDFVALCGNCTEEFVIA